MNERNENKNESTQHDSKYNDISVIFFLLLNTADTTKCIRYKRSIQYA